MRERLKSDGCELLRNELKKGRRITAFDAELICEIDVRNAREHLKALHDADETHIEGWRRDANVGPWTPVYAWGQNKDTPKPRPKIRVYVAQ
jgi:hypothetical protein